MLDRERHLLPKFGETTREIHRCLLVLADLGATAQRHLWSCAESHLLEELSPARIIMEGTVQAVVFQFGE